MPLCVPVDVFRLYLPDDMKKKYAWSFKIIGILQIIIAGITIVMEGGAITFYIRRMGYYPTIAPGCWGGAIFFIAGVFCFFSGKSGRIFNVVAGMVFAVLSILAAAVTIFCNAYFANKFIRQKWEKLEFLTHDEDTKLIPPLIILIAASSFEVLLSVFHFSIGCVTSKSCSCCTWKRQMRVTEIRMTRPRMTVSAVSNNAVVRAQSFQYHEVYSTGTTDRLFHSYYT